MLFRRHSVRADTEEHCGVAANCDAELTQLSRGNNPSSFQMKASVPGRVVTDSRESVAKRRITHAACKDVVIRVSGTRRSCPFSLKLSLKVSGELWFGHMTVDQMRYCSPWIKPVHEGARYGGEIQLH